MTGEPIDPGVVELAGRVFDLARGGRTEDLAAYLDAGVPADLTNDKGDTLLILAAYHGHPETVAALLDRGADHSRANDRGQTALAAAVFRQSIETVTRLLRAVPHRTPAAPARGRPRSFSSCRRWWSCSTVGSAPGISRQARRPADVHGVGQDARPGGRGGHGGATRRARDRPCRPPGAVAPRVRGASRAGARGRSDRRA